MELAKLSKRLVRRQCCRTKVKKNKEYTHESMGRGERVWLYIRATTEDVFLSPYCVYPISGGRQECMAPTCTNSESESAATLKHTEQTGLISEENQTPAAVCCSPHPLSQNYPWQAEGKKTTHSETQHNSTGRKQVQEICKMHQLN